MIFFGTRATVRATSGLIGEPCAYCGTNRFSRVTSFRYFHVYWIPMFPVGSHSALQCDHCKKVYEGQEAKKRKVLSGPEKQSASRTPIWHFAGLIVLGSLMVFGFVVSQLSQNKLRKLSGNPVIGDLYIVDNAHMTVVPMSNSAQTHQVRDAVAKSDEKSSFSFWRLESSTDGELRFAISRQAYKYESDAVKEGRLGADNATMYAKDIVVVRKADLKDLFSVRAIVDIVPKSDGRTAPN